ncbi:MAG: GNAT family N-acetyltransferase [Eubacteriales bacterium]|nr:GNAT family N-acetyltransferase [Eubacteriales bacterium]
MLIDRRYQNRGYGRIMLRLGMDILKKAGAKKLELYFSRNNSAALGRYKSVGFEIVARYPNVCLMECNLTE